MQNPAFLKMLSKYFPVAGAKSKADAGFTLIEMMVVVIMIGVLAAIAAPGWLGFVSQQRVSAANDGVFRALQDAQREAKKTKLSYNVSFRVDNQIPQVAVYQEGSTTTTTIPWRNLNEREAKAAQVLLYTNIDKANPNNFSSAIKYDDLNEPRTITFDYQGVLAGNPKIDDNGLQVVVAVPDPADYTKPLRAKRCVIVQTLIGGMRTAQDDKCSS